MTCLDRKAASCWVVAGWGWGGGSLEGGTEPVWCLSLFLVDRGQVHMVHTASRTPLLQFSGSEHVRSRGCAPIPRTSSSSQTLSPDTSSLLPSPPSPAPLILLSVSDFDNSGDLT